MTALQAKTSNARSKAHACSPTLCMLAFCALCISIPSTSGDEPQSPLPDHVRQIDLVHFSHTDFGFTDHPEVCHELYRRFFDVAVDAAAATADRPPDGRFCWTAETTEPVRAWWQAASPERRQQLLDAVRRGQIEVTALPLNNTPFLDAAQWQLMLNWLDRDLLRSVQPKAAVQNDVNGFPRAGAMLLLDRGVRYLFTGINEDSGGTPFPRPSAFWWKMPDGRRLFVWLNVGYGSGFDFFEPHEWRRGPVPLASDGRYHPPRAEEILKTDEASLRAAHRRCVERIRDIEKAGYSADVLTISITNQWRFDNDPPFPQMADFVAAWNRLGLKPTMKMVTVSAAMQDLEKAFGDKAPEYAGEWTDWWANGTAGAPREVAASRMAKRYLAATRSPVCGPLDAGSLAASEELYRQLCLFDEHTWGAANSVALPYSLDTLGQFNEKARLAYRPMAKSQWLLSQRIRREVVGRAEGLWIANPAGAAFTGWVRMPASCLREDYQSLNDVKTGASIPLYFDRGLRQFGRPERPEDLTREDVSATFADNAPEQIARFWLDQLDANSLRHFQLIKEKAPSNPKTGTRPTVQLDEQGWPTTATWPGMTQPLFLMGIGEFTAIQVKAFAPRWALREIWNRGHDEKRAELRRKRLKETVAEAEGQTVAEETPHTLVYTQTLKHPRLKWATRVLEIWKDGPRARLTFRLNRLSSFDPEIFYITFAVPCDDKLPRLTCGGMSFTPFEDQLPGTCRDYFAIDGSAHYTTDAGHWLWVSRDAPLVTLGGPQPLARLESPPERTGQLLSMVYNNFWYTNFVGDSPGVMEFQYDLVWRKTLDEAEANGLAEALTMEPIQVINPAAPEQPLYLKNLYRP